MCSCSTVCFPLPKLFHFCITLSKGTSAAPQAAPHLLFCPAPSHSLSSPEAWHAQPLPTGLQTPCRPSVLCGNPTFLLSLSSLTLLNIFHTFILFSSYQHPSHQLTFSRCLCFSFYLGNVVVVQSLSHILLFAIPWTVACQAPLSMGFPRQEYWSGLSFPSPGDLPNSGIEPASPGLAGGFFTTEPPGKPT